MGEMILTLLLSFVISISAGGQEECGDITLIKPLCDVLNSTIKMDQNEPSKCINNENQVVGLSYAFCGKTRLPEEFISENLIFVDFRQGICVYTSDQTSIGDLYAATKLQQLFVDKVCDKCPGSSMCQTGNQTQLNFTSHGILISFHKKIMVFALLQSHFVTLMAIRKHSITIPVQKIQNALTTVSDLSIVSVLKGIMDTVAWKVVHSHLQWS